MEFISNLLNCQYSSLRKMLSQTRSRSFIIRKPEITRENLRTMSLGKKREILQATERQCHFNPFRIAKFFRLRLADILPVMNDPKSVIGRKFKVILLIRDPRAIINSLLKAPHEWINLVPNPKMACTNIYNDLTAYNSVISDENLQERIMIVKYEDLVTRPKEVALKMYKFIGIEHLIEYAYQYLTDHQFTNDTTKQSPIDVNDVSENDAKSVSKVSNFNDAISTEKNAIILDDYFTTFRNATFRHDHWRRELNATQLQDIENFPDCQSALEMLGYD